MHACVLLLVHASHEAARALAALDAALVHAAPDLEEA